MCDKHFKYTPKKIEKLFQDYVHAPEKLMSHLQDSKLFLVYEEKQADFIEVDEHKE